MLARHLGKTWQIDSFNENHPAAFKNWELRDLSVIREVVERSCAPVALFKSIRATVRANELLSELPEAKCLFIYRHYDDVVNSMFKKLVEHDFHPLLDRFRDDNSEFAIAPEITKQFIMERRNCVTNKATSSALQWLFRNRLFFDLNLAQDNRVMPVQYESIVSRPEPEFRRMCDFLNVKFESGIIKGIHSASIGRKPSANIDPQIRIACEELWEKLCGFSEVREKTSGKIESGVDN